MNALVDARGRALALCLSAGNLHDISSALRTVGIWRPKMLLADKGYDSQAFRKWLRARRMRPVIPGRANLKRKVRHDRGAYRRRNQVERFFGRMKEWSALALRRAKDDEVFLATIQLFSVLDWLKSLKHTA